MKWTLTLLGTGLAASIASVALAGDESASRVEAACIAANERFTNACPCIIQAGRAQEMSDEEMIAIMTRDTENYPALPTQLARFYRARFDCVIAAAQAERSGSDGAPYTAAPTRPQPRPADGYIGKASTGTQKSD